MLDAGSGTGVLGICAAGALKAIDGPAEGFRVHAQDRDGLARLFTEYNARRNNTGAGELTACTGPLLSGEAGQRWDLILTNIPAKAGIPVLEDFVSRSAGLLTGDGRVFLVAVNTLAGFFRSRIAAAGAPLLSEETGKGHTVFVYGGNGASASPLVFDGNFPRNYPFYIRNRNDYAMENIPYHLDTVYGAPDFDGPGGAVMAAAKLTVKIYPASKPGGAPGAAENGTSLLIHDTGQGHFALWLAGYLETAAEHCRWVLSGRNILALGAARAALNGALNTAAGRPLPAIVPQADTFPEPEQFPLATGDWGGFDFTAFFPESVPDAAAAWEGLARLAAPGGIIIIGMASTEADRFDRQKPPVFTRAGDIKRKGFRALAYRKNS